MSIGGFHIDDDFEEAYRKRREKDMQLTDSVIVSFDCTNGRDKCVLVVGHKTPGEVIQIVNAFQGKEAAELWRRLTYKEGKHGEI